MACNGQGGGGKEQLAAIGGMIVRSQSLDGEGREMSAYLSYLGTVQYISQCIAADITTNEGRGSLARGKTVSLFKMAGKCLERAEEMYDAAQGEGRGLTGEGVAVGVASSVPTSLPSQVSPVHYHSNTLPAVHMSSATPNHTPSLPGRTQSVPSSPSLSLSPNPAAMKYHSVGTSYMREARMRNQYMMEQYKAHLRSQMQPRSQEMGLSMLRRLEENISVAKIRQQNVARKAKERQLRLQQQADTSKSKKVQVVRLSQMSVEELREQVASFEHGKHFPILSALKQRLSERHEELKSRLSSHTPHTPHSPTTITSSSSTATEVYNFINDIVSNPDHPLSRLLGEYQMEVFTLLKPLHSARQRTGEDMPKIIIQEKVSNQKKESQSGPERLPSPPLSVQPPSNHTPTELTSSHPTPSHPHTVTTPAEEDSAGLDLLYMNSDSEEEEEDDFFTLSTDPVEDKLPPVPSNLPPSGLPPGVHEGSNNDRGRDEGEDKLARLRAELEREIAGSCESGEGVRGEEVREEGGCEDGGKLVTQLLHMVDEGEEGMGESGVGVMSEDSVFGDGGRLTQLHTLLEEPSEEEEQSDNNIGRDHTPPLPPRDATDGGAFSRPPPPPEEPTEEEEVVFRSLVPLSCRCYYGMEEELKALKTTAEPVLVQAVTLIHSSLDKLEELFTTCYPTLSQDPQREETQLVLESLLFPAVLPPLLAAYRCRHYLEEVCTARNMCRHVNVTPKDLDVRKRFWLLEQPSPPYHEAITELCRVIDLHTPSAKLSCLVRTSRQVVQCIDDFYCTQGQSEEATDSGVGVDDILPIMTYVIIRSALPQLVSEAALMEEFIQEGYMKGEEGFCLTSFMTALKFVTRMSS